METVYQIGLDFMGTIKTETNCMRYPLRIILALLLFIFAFPPEGIPFRAFSGESSETSQTEGKNESARDEFGIRFSPLFRIGVIRRTKRLTISETVNPGCSHGMDGIRLKNSVYSPNNLLIENPRQFSAAILRI
jgi:hypothetical protein